MKVEFDQDREMLRKKIENERKQSAPKGWKGMVVKGISKIPREWYIRQVPCPDGIEGCLVYHEGYTWAAPFLRPFFNLKRKLDTRPLIIFEEIGPAIVNPRAFKEINIEG